MNKSPEMRNSNLYHDYRDSNASNCRSDGPRSSDGDATGFPLAPALRRVDGALDRLLASVRRGARPGAPEWLSGLPLDDLLALVHVLCEARAGHAGCIGPAYRLTSLLAPTGNPACARPLLDLIVLALSMMPSTPLEEGLPLI